MNNVKVGLVQMTCTAGKEQNLQKAISKVREAAGQGAQIVCLQELFTSLYFCDVEDYDNFALAEAIPGPSTDSLAAVAAELGVVIIASLFEKRAKGVYHNTTAPGRPRFLRKVLLYPRRFRLQSFQDQICCHRRTHLLGPMVPRSRPHYRVNGRRDIILPNRHRLGDHAGRSHQQRAIQRLANHTTLARGSQRRTRSKRKPHRAGRRAKILGRLVYLQSIRQGTVPGIAQRRGNYSAGY
jgi:hypothetical protein